MFHFLWVWHNLFFTFSKIRWRGLLKYPENHLTWLKVPSAPTVWPPGATKRNALPIRYNSLCICARAPQSWLCSLYLRLTIDLLVSSQWQARMKGKPWRSGHSRGLARTPQRDATLRGVQKEQQGPMLPEASGWLFSVFQIVLHVLLGQPQSHSL